MACTGCSTVLMGVSDDALALVGPRPVELLGNLEGNLFITCPSCGALVAVERSLIVLY